MTCLPCNALFLIPLYDWVYLLGNLLEIYLLNSHLVFNISPFSLLPLMLYKSIQSTISSTPWFNIPPLTVPNQKASAIMNFSIDICLNHFLWKSLVFLYVLWLTSLFPGLWSEGTTRYKGCNNPNQDHNQDGNSLYNAVAATQFVVWLVWQIFTTSQ